jgi:hypothetical protein
LLRAEDGSVLEILEADPRVIRSVRVRPHREEKHEEEA